jgi:NAD(P)-dependent dehydrogenase (short-subunit alcohol dehydrogenase family)
MLMTAFADVSHQSIEELISLRSRNAVVTGAAQGIGKAIAYRLAQAGANLLLVDRQDQVQSFASELQKSSGGQITTLVGDVQHRATASLAARRVSDTFGRLDIWVNDAGIYPVHPSLDLSEEVWQQTLATDLSGTFFGCQAAAQSMQPTGGGVIVNISSSLSFRSVPGQAAYVAAKWEVRGLTAALAAEWGRYQIRVLAVAPGLRTPSMLRVMQELDEKTGGSAAAAFAAQLPSGRLAGGDDIARAVLFAASDLGKYMTGSTLLVDGGEVYAAGATAASE